MARALIALSLVGFVISAYLAYSKLANSAPYCAGLGSCAQVQASPYSQVKGVPVAVLGLAYYAGLAGLGAVRAVGRGGEGVVLAMFGLALAGTLYSAYLTYLEFFVVLAICLWCLASAAVVTAILGLSIPGLRQQP
ncbi:MAG: vitamin K epoxide reductase family protein [Chloroflexi bacterium]|nr:vitamin K epoxide reductase family protein [Chloroflexota bacterium]